MKPPTSSPRSGLLDRQFKHGRRIAVSLLIAAITIVAWPFLDMPLGFGLFVLVVQVVGYNVISSNLGSSPPEPLRKTLHFVAAVLGASLVWGAAILLLGYGASR